jgi:protein arginine kinase
VQSGLQIEKAWHMLSLLDDELGGRLEYDFSQQFGYLTACPTNTGTGMRASIFTHLPALAVLGRVEDVVKEMSASEITVRGFHGEGTGVQGNIFQISNQLTLGRSEELIIKRLQTVAEKFVELERDARKELLDEKKRRVQDMVLRAHAILKSAQLLSSFELIHLLSAVRLGSEQEMSEPVPRATLNELLVIMQPAHLQKRLGKEMEDEERDACRARLVREYLNISPFVQE